MKLSILYYSRDKDYGINEIIKYQTSILDWVIKLVVISNISIEVLYLLYFIIFSNLLIFYLHNKNESTIMLVVKIINLINYMVMHCCLMEFLNTTFFDNFFTFCATLLHSKKIFFTITTIFLILLLNSLFMLFRFFGPSSFINNDCNFSKNRKTFALFKTSR